jgi:putative protease
MIEHIPEMIDAGIYSFKVEGRMKTALYVAAAARAYRQAIDDYLTSEELYRSRMAYYKEEIEACTFRQFTTGFYFEKPTHETQIYDSNTYVKNYTYLGTVEAVADTEEPEKARIVFSQKNKFSVGDTISVMLFDGRNLNCRVISIQDEEQTEMPSAPHPKQKLFVQLAGVDDPEEHPAQYIQPGMIIRTKHCEV